jgi:23S rRNA pseudouridine1911/1915/1917 synthase
MEILYEDNHLIFVNKPAGMLAQGDITGEDNVVDLLKAYRKKNEGKTGEAFVGLVHRLDRPVSGVMVLAKTSKAAQRLNAIWHTENVVKLYRAVTRRGTGLPPDTWTIWQDWLIKDRQTNHVRVVASNDSGRSEAQLAQLKIRTVQESGPFAEVEIELGTGRGHQIRVQLASRGFAIVGDTKYGSRERYLDQTSHARIALHAESLSVTHPTLKTALKISAPKPVGWPI